MNFAGLALRERTYAPGLRQPRHTHDHSNITIVTGGELDEASPAGEHHAIAFSVVVKRAGCEHEDRISGFGARTLSIEFAADDAGVPEWTWLETPEATRAALSLHRAWAHGDALAVSVNATMIIDIAKRPKSEATRPTWLEPLLARIDAGADEPFRFEDIAREFGLHPVYLARAFRRHLNTSMTDYVRSLRVRRARHLLASTRRSTTAIAAASGFSDASHLCRTFTRLLGSTPETYRQQVRKQVQCVP